MITTKLWCSTNIADGKDHLFLENVIIVAKQYSRNIGEVKC